MTTWSQGGNAPSSNWSGDAPSPTSGWAACDAEPDSAWRPCGLSIDPATGEQGETVAVTIRGDGFTGGSVVTVSGIGVAVQHTVIVNDTTITADLVIASDASADARTVTVATGTRSEVVGFTVEASWASIAGRVLWLEADADADLTIATGVSAWADHSGNGRVLVQATGSRQPTLAAGAMNGRQAVRFDGVNDLLTLLSDFELKNGSTVVIVANVRFVNDTNYRPLFRVEGSNATGVQHQASNDGVSPSKLEAFATATAGLKRATPSAVTAQGIRCITVVADPGAGTLTIYRDGVSVGTVSAVTGLTTSIGDTLRLCADATGVNFGTYDIGTVRVYQRALTTIEQQAVEADAMSRWVP